VFPEIIGDPVIRKKPRFQLPVAQLLLRLADDVWFRRDVSITSKKTPTDRRVIYIYVW